jgi:MFS family permease
VVIVLTLAGTVSFIDRQILGMMVGPIRRDLGISDTQMGLLMGLPFAILYGLASLPMARLADRYVRKSIAAAGVFAWSLMTALSGLAGSYYQLFLARMGVGIGEASLSPAAFSMLTDYFPRRQLALATAIFASAPFLGNGLANIVGGAVVESLESVPRITIPVLGDVRSWQVTFFLVGIPGLALSFSGTFDMSDGAVPITAVLGFVRDRGSLFALHFAALLCFSVVGFGLFAWMPEFLIRVHGMARSQVGLIFGTTQIVFGLAGASFAGWLVAALMQRGHSDANLKVMIIAALGLIPCAAATLLVSNTNLVLLALLPLTFGMAMPTGPATATLQIIAPNEIRAQIVAIYLLVVSTLSYILGPLLTGFLNDMFFTGETGIRYSLWTIALITYPLAALLLLMGLRPYKRAMVTARAWDQEPEDDSYA